MIWEDLEYWRSEDWRVIQTRLDGLEAEGTKICPNRRDLFKSLDLVDLEDVRVVIVGQDPYPDPQYATGVAFSIPHWCKTFPLTLAIIFKEYQDDLHLPIPSSGDLTPWCDQGVLLWNAVPSCEQRKTLSHYAWPEWRALSSEIIRVLSGKKVVLCFLGKIPREFVPEAGSERIICTAHPAASRYGKTWRNNLFSGSRFFTTVNSKLTQMAQHPIDWRLT